MFSINYKRQKKPNRKLCPFFKNCGQLKQGGLRLLPYVSFIIQFSIKMLKSEQQMFKMLEDIVRATNELQSIDEQLMNEQEDRISLHQRKEVFY